MCPSLLLPKVVTYYNQMHDADDKKSCENFDLNVTIEESKGKKKLQHCVFLVIGLWLGY